jgi:hypothetical protein
MGLLVEGACLSINTLEENLMKMHETIDSKSARPFLVALASQGCKKQSSERSSVE